jgi:hypothetical protein
MTARRRLLTAASAALALSALTACERPAPIVTLVSGGTSVYAEASQFCFDEDASLEQGECAQREDEVKQLPVRPFERIGVDVGKELTERRWQFSLADPADPQNAQRSPVQDGHWFAFSAPQIPQDSSLLLTVVALGEGDAPSGEWVFELVPKQ